MTFRTILSDLCTVLGIRRDADRLLADKRAGWLAKIRPGDEVTIVVEPGMTGPGVVTVAGIETISISVHLGARVYMASRRTGELIGDVGHIQEMGT